jgi:Helix-turn-helix domain
MGNASQQTTLRNNTPSQTPRSNSNRAHAQRQRLLEHLKIAPINTVTARRELDILCPAARVLELRRRGYRIETIWIDCKTDCGKVHRVALYILQS